MPNMPSLPSAADLLRGSAGLQREAYGRHASVTVTEDGATLLNAQSRIVAHVTRDTGEPRIALDQVDTEVVPYVNAFVRDHGLKVEKYWRTGEYRVKGAVQRPSTVKVRNVETRVDEAEVTRVETIATEPLPPVAAPEPVVVADDDPIPGLEHPAPIKAKSLGHGLVSLGGITIPEADLNTLQDAWDLRQADVPAAVLITGPAGTAKTMLVKAFAATLGVDYLKIDAGQVRTVDDWSGTFRQDRNTGRWDHRWSPFARALRRGTPMVILIDELTRTESPQALNALTGLLDWTKTMLVPDANEVLTLPAGILVVATANIGPEYVGSLPLDGAIRQRFPHGIRMGYPGETTEPGIITAMTGLGKDEAERLVSFAELQRANRDDPQQFPSGAVVSTRMLIDIAKRVTLKGRPLREAVMASLAAQFDTGDFPALNIIVDSQFPVEVVIEDDTVKEISPEEIMAEVTKQAAKASNDFIKQQMEIGRIQCQGTVLNGGACGRFYAAQSPSCNICGTPNPITTALSAAAAAKPKPLITVAKHYFVNRGLDGQLTTQCAYRPDPANTKTCGRLRGHAIHH